jgi:hypothetical protein
MISYDISMVQKANSYHLSSHPIILSSSYHLIWMGKYEVTVAQFRQFIQETDYKGKG